MLKLIDEHTGANGTSSTPEQEKPPGAELPRDEHEELVERAEAIEAELHRIGDSVTKLS